MTTYSRSVSVICEYAENTKPEHKGEITTRPRLSAILSPKKVSADTYGQSVTPLALTQVIYQRIMGRFQRSMRVICLGDGTLYWHVTNIFPQR